MESALEKIELMSKGIDELSYKVISKKIIDDFLKGRFSKAKDLASECFVAISQITKFAQKIGYAGYQELLFTLKNEYQHQGYNQVGSKINSSEIFNSIQNWIEYNNEFTQNLVKEIQNTKIINLYSSYQVRHAAEYFVDLLQDLNKTAKIVSNEFRSDLVKNDEDELNIVLLCSDNSNSLIKIFSEQNNLNQKSFLIATERQMNKIDSIFQKQMLVNYEFDRSNKANRNIALEMLFFHIYEVMKTLST